MLGRRQAPGAGMRLLQERQRRADGGKPANVLAMLLDEYEDGLRAAGASEAYIAKEVAVLKQLQREHKEARDKVKGSRRRRREVTEELNPYLEAEIRRTAGVVADEVLESLKRGD